MINHHQTVSAYLGKPDTSRRHLRSWEGFRTKFVEIKRDNPRLLGRSLVAMVIWTACVAALQTVGHGGVAATGRQLVLPNPASLASTAGVHSQAQATVATAVHAQELPSGPSGQLLPPGTMAPDNTYRNSYARGQCTWYVAGRRQIPSNWGNANAWYYHATALRWSVGATPAIAAIAWTNAGYYGHVALVEQVSADGSQVYVSEMNYVGVGRKSFRWTSAKEFKYIY